MTSRLIAPLLCLCMTGHAQAQVPHVSLTGVTALAGVDAELNWRDPQWLARQREHSRWRYQIGLEQQLHAPVRLGPQAAVREAVWAGVSYDLTTRLSGGLEAPVWQRDTGWAARMDFERPRGQGLAGLRGALTYRTGPQSKLMLRPQARRVMVSFAATW
ncbi:MAG TPA: hypothetical protein VGE36_00010 [Roseateles sp.]